MVSFSLGAFPNPKHKANLENLGFPWAGGRQEGQRNKKRFLLKLLQNSEVTEISRNKKF